MKFFRKYEPTDTQKSIIREFQILHLKWDGSDSLPTPYITCLANTEQNLYFYPRDTVQVFDTSNSEGLTAPTSSITGPKSKPVGLTFGHDYLMIKVAFLPTGLYRLLKIPMKKTVNAGLNAIEFMSQGSDDETLVTVEFKETAKGCTILIKHTGFRSKETKEMHDSGWDNYIKGLLEVVLRRSD